MESASTACTTHDTASGCGWTLKKLKHRKVHAARSLKLRGGQEEQDRYPRRLVPPQALSLSLLSLSLSLLFATLSRAEVLRLFHLFQLINFCATVMYFHRLEPSKHSRIPNHWQRLPNLIVI